MYHVILISGEQFVKSHAGNKFRWRRLIASGIVCIVLLYLLLLIPEAQFEMEDKALSHPFVWDQDELWASLENRFQAARVSGCDSLSIPIDSGITHVQRLLGNIAQDSFPPSALILDTLEAAIFSLAAMTGACPGRFREYLELYISMRMVIKEQSRDWDMNTVDARHRLYRLLYGGRAAIEEIMLQASPKAIPSLVEGFHEPSATSQASILGMTVHSGDILISRGGAPTSALIARGNDYPGNFSHVALVHVDDKTGKVSIIESHIESGVGIASIDDYLRDTKLRIMVLRLRADLPQIMADPILPHKAALAALAEAQARHIAYDFEMDFENPDKYFCSEVASAPYGDLGVNLWMGISRISSLKLRNWLAALGVRHFETQEPSDLEYDPQLRVVAEWRDSDLLYKDHLDNAVLDAMLEGGDSTKTLDYDGYMLPFARILKAYSVFRNIFGSIGPIPEGMSATAALRVDRFSRKHLAIKRELIRLANEFRTEQGYSPLYWVMVRLAGQAKKDLEQGSQ
jgi:hypothetical protein